MAKRKKTNVQNILSEYDLQVEGDRNQIYLHHDRTHVLKTSFHDTNEITFLKTFKEKTGSYPNHDHIAPVDIRDEIYIQIPFYKESDLFYAVIEKHKRFTCGQVRQIASELCQAIAFLHQHDVLYGDVKLENICLSEGHVKLIDFDRCLFVPDNTTITLFASTTSSLAPEVVSNYINRNKNSYQPTPFGKEIDWWAVGVVIYELAYGIHPFQNGTDLPNSVANRIIKHNPYKCQKVIDPLIRDFVDSLLIKNRMYRLMSDHEIMAHPLINF